MIENKENVSEGLTPSEEYLGKLARNSFLSLWSYQNLFRDKGKELADLVVICGDVVLVFSDKRVAFAEDVDLAVAWPRWYNRAIRSSVKQLKRASGWIERHPDRIFFDPQCEKRVTALDVGETFEVHRIAVANGAASACLKHFGGGSGSLIVSSTETAENPAPFCVGNPAGDSSFVHVFDEAHLHIVLQELDTIKDFAQYLRARERLISQKKTRFRCK